MMNTANHKSMVTSSGLEEPLQRLARFSTPTVANVINLLGVRDRLCGFAGQDIRAMFDVSVPVVGYAVTATCRSTPASAPAQPFGTDVLIERAASLPSPRIMVIQDLEQPPRSAIFGEVLATAFCRCGFIGIITDGPMRDIEQVRRLGLPCWTSGITAGFAGGGYLNAGTEVTLAGMTVRSGDLLHADANGIVQVPADLAPLIAELCDPYDAIEQRAIAAMNDGSMSPDHLKSIFAKLRAETGALRERARERLADLARADAAFADPITPD